MRHTSQTSYRVPYGPLGKRMPFLGYLFSILTVIAATIGRIWLESVHGALASPFIFYYPAVVLSVWFGGGGPGLTATLLGALCGSYFFLEPNPSLLVMDFQYLLFLGLFLFVNFTISVVTESFYRSIARQHHISSKLMQFQSKITNILESIQGCFLSLNEELRFIHINEDSKEYISMPRENLYGKALWECFPAWKGTEFETRLSDAMEAKKAAEFEFHDTAASKWYEIHVAPHNEGVSLHIYDITSRKEIENSLIESENRFRLVAEQAPVMFWMSGPDALCHHFNETWLKFRGKTMEEEKGNGWIEGIHPEDRQGFLDDYLKAFHARQGFRKEFRLLREDARYRWVLSISIPHVNADRKFVGYIGSAIDITARKDTELRQMMEHRLTQIMSEEKPLEDIFSNILQVICDELGWEIGAYWAVDVDSNQIRCRQIWTRERFDGPDSQAFRSESLNGSYAPGVGLPGRIWTLGKAFWIEALDLDDNFLRNASAGKAGLQGGVGFPIRSGAELLGVMEFFNKESRAPDLNLLQVFESIGSEIGQVIERRKAEAALKAAYEEMERRVEHRTSQLGKINTALNQEITERKRVEKEVLEISEKEQRRLGTQIHDDLCQNLAGIMILLKVLVQKMERDGDPEALDLKKVALLLDQSITQAREMARGLYPVELKGDSLMLMLGELASRTAVLHGVSCRFLCPTPIFIEDNNLATHLFRICQEAVRNAVLHGRAHAVEIRLTQDGAMMLLEIEDDGGGLGDKKVGHGIGLQIMRYRARMIDAVLNIRNREPHGALLSCSFSQSSPIPSEKGPDLDNELKRAGG